MVLCGRKLLTTNRHMDEIISKQDTALQQSALFIVANCSPLSYPLPKGNNWNAWWIKVPPVPTADDLSSCYRPDVHNANNSSRETIWKNWPNDLIPIW